MDFFIYTKYFTLSVIPLDSLNEVIIEDESIDIVYTLFTTAVVNDLTLLLSYIPFIEKEFVEEYIRLLNQRNINNLTLLEKTKINNFLKEYSQFVPIGNIYHQFKCKNSKQILNIDKNDTYYWGSKIDEV
ncbi:hypothetical protein WM9_00936 [Enterococcus faecalis EnGen0345]|uniref:hypothetical protein n=1 Tax=Enterococcus faecalis TaxID=1351 RepID=UPI0003312DBE|nr:hypothetical protein [Enterococcus faecalis]EOJ52434.1 hypothetical protein WM9_00936 [Enterococcus faecalis EnGen0345]